MVELWANSVWFVKVNWWYVQERSAICRKRYFDENWLVVSHPIILIFTNDKHLFQMGWTQKYDLRKKRMDLVRRHWIQTAWEHNHQYDKEDIEPCLAETIVLAVFANNFEGKCRGNWVFFLRESWGKRTMRFLVTEVVTKSNHSQC